jgi:hypothetical protein
MPGRHRRHALAPRSVARCKDRTPLPARAAGLKPEKRQADPAKPESCRAGNGDCRDWDRKPDDLSTHISHLKRKAGGTTPPGGQGYGHAVPVKRSSGGMRARFNGHAIGSKFLDLQVISRTVTSSSGALRTAIISMNSIRFRT